MKTRKPVDEISFVSGSLFSGGGVGDAGIEWGAKVPVLAACELVPSRAALIRNNFPDTKVFEGDIWKLEESYVRYFKSKLEGKRPWLLTLSPPCQGMSSNGAGRISASIRQGNRPQEDERNRLILPGINAFGKTATGLVHSRKRTENGKYGYPEREERTGKHTPLSGPTPSSAWLFDPGERSGLPCLRSSPSPFAVDHHRLPDSFPCPGTWPRPFGVFERIELLSSSPYARFGWQALFRQFASGNR